MEKEKLTYTRAIRKLEQIVNEVESGNPDIDVLCDKIKEAQALIKFCKDKLYKTEKEVQDLLAKEK